MLAQLDKCLMRIGAMTYNLKILLLNGGVNGRQSTHEICLVIVECSQIDRSLKVTEYVLRQRVRSHDSGKTQSPVVKGPGLQSGH